MRFDPFIALKKAIAQKLGERAMKPVAIGRKNWMFAGSQRGGKGNGHGFALIETAKLNWTLLPDCH